MQLCVKSVTKGGIVATCITFDKASKHKPALTLPRGVDSKVALDSLSSAK